MSASAHTIDPLPEHPEGALASLHGLLDASTIAAAVAVYDRIAAVARSEDLQLCAAAGLERWGSLQARPAALPVTQAPTPPAPMAAVAPRLVAIEEGVRRGAAPVPVVVDAPTVGLAPAVQEPVLPVPAVPAVPVVASAAASTPTPRFSFDVVAYTRQQVDAAFAELAA